MPLTQLTVIEVLSVVDVVLFCGVTILMVLVQPCVIAVAMLCGLPSLVAPPAMLHATDHQLPPASAAAQVDPPWAWPGGVISMTALGVEPVGRSAEQRANGRTPELMEFGTSPGGAPPRAVVIESMPSKRAKPVSVEPLAAYPTSSSPWELQAGVM